jgi:predicted  nucleic acid-binding Zn-ribbon protein
MLELIEKAVTVIVAVMSAYFILRERIVKLEIKISDLEESQKEANKRNADTFDKLGNSIDKLSGVISKLEKSVVKLETQLEERKNNENSNYKN